MNTMNVSLGETFKEYVEKKVATGLYNSASEVIRDALRLMQRLDAEHEAKLTALRRDIQAGFDSGLAGRLDIEDVIRQASAGPRA